MDAVDKLIAFCRGGAMGQLDFENRIEHKYDYNAFAMLTEALTPMTWWYPPMSPVPLGWDTNRYGVTIERIMSGGLCKGAWAHHRALSMSIIRPGRFRLGGGKDPAHAMFLDKRLLGIFTVIRYAPIITPRLGLSVAGGVPAC